MQRRASREPTLSEVEGSRRATTESVSQARAQKKSGTSYRSSREAATQESPARQCREDRVEQTESRQGRHPVATLARLSTGNLGSTAVTITRSRY